MKTRYKILIILLTSVFVLMIIFVGYYGLKFLYKLKIDTSQTSSMSQLNVALCEALSGYYAEKGKYPERLDTLVGTYLHGSGDIPQKKEDILKLLKNFKYSSDGNNCETVWITDVRGPTIIETYIYKNRGVNGKMFREHYINNKLNSSYQYPMSDANLPKLTK